MLKNKPFGYSFFSFFRYNVSGGMLLMLMAVLAMIVANSPWSSYYSAFLQYPISLKFGDFNILNHHGEPLNMALFINDCLMVIFFFHVGLEIKREILVGELSSVKKASLPIFAAIGGMVVPVSIYFLFNDSLIGSRGAAIPMATDIAFSLGILSMLGKRVPLGLKIFLTAFAVVDDIGGILVIALFYNSGIELSSLFIALALLLALVGLNQLKVQTRFLYVLLGIAVWYFVLQSGIHSTIAGVLVAFTIPAKPRLRIQKYINRIKRSADVFPESKQKSIVLTNDQIHELKNIEAASDRVISPLQYMEDKLKMLVNFFILPLFAFANAGVALNGDGELWGAVTFAVMGGLILGKPIGIFAMTWLSVKLRLVSLPDEVSWKMILGVGCLGGVGFTVSLFIANLSFDSVSQEMLNQAKLGIIIGSVVSGVIGYLLLRAFIAKKE